MIKILKFKLIIININLKWFGEYFKCRRRAYKLKNYRKYNYKNLNT